MAFFIYPVIFSVVFLQARQKFGNWINIVSLFSGIWCGFGLLSTLGMDHLRIPSLQVHAYAWTFILIVSEWILLFAKENKSASGFFLEDNPWNFRHSYLMTGQILALVIYSPVFFSSMQIFLKTFSLTEVRNAYFFGDSLTSNPILSLLMRSAAPALIEILVIAYLYIAMNRNKPGYIVLAVLNVCILTLGNGGRYAIFLLILASALLISLPHKKRMRSTKSKKMRARLIRGAAVAIVIMAIVTELRGQSLISSTISYFSGSFSFLDYMLEHPAQFDLHEPLYGYLTFGAILEPLVLFLKYAGATTAKIPSYYFNIVAQPFYDIGRDGVTHLFNNNSTVLYYFLRDAGMVGVITGSVLLASLVVWSYNRLQKKNSACNVLLYLYFSVVLLETIMTYQLFGTGTFFTICSILFCTQHKRVILRFRRKSGDSAIRR